MIKISDGKTLKARRYRALIAYTCLVLASAFLVFLSHKISSFFGIDPSVRIRDLEPIAVLLVMGSICISGIVIIFFILKLVDKLFALFKI